jgi:hypothetical protein
MHQSMLEEIKYYHNVQKPYSLNFTFTIAKSLNYKTFINRGYKIRLWRIAKNVATWECDHLKEIYFELMHMCILLEEKIV